MSDDPAYDKARAEYMASDVEYTPVRSRRGKVHATTWETATKTICGITCSGWAVALEPLSCPVCRLVVHIDCRPKRKRYNNKRGRTYRRAAR